MFVIGSAYFHPELMERFLANEHLESSLRLAVLLIISYVTGIILSATVVLPFTVITYVFSHAGTLVMISMARSRSKAPIQPSSRPAFRRAATVVLGSAMVPQSPEANADALAKRLLAYFGRADNNQTSEPARDSIPDEAHLKILAMKIFQPDFEEQWNDIYKGLFQLQSKEQSPSETVAIALEPTLSVAAAIIVWRWLAFPVPIVLQWAAIVTFAYFGVTLIAVGIVHGINYMDGSSLESFLFRKLLDRTNGSKAGE